MATARQFPWTVWFLVVTTSGSVTSFQQSTLLHSVRKPYSLRFISSTTTPTSTTTGSTTICFVAQQNDDTSNDSDYSSKAQVSSKPPPPSSSSSQQENKNDKDKDDSLWKFSQDVKHVLHDLRGMDYDPYIAKYLIGNPSTLSYSKTWTLQDWEVHNSRWRYFRYLRNFPLSRLLRRIIPQQTVLLVWTLLSVWVEDTFLLGKMPKVPLSALGPISTFLAFLMTLRSNQGLARLDEARKLWSKLILNTREMAQLIAAFVYPVDKQLALMLGRHVALFGWLLKSQLRFTKKEEVVDIVAAMLPNKRDADYVLSQRQKTVAVITRIRQVISKLGKEHRLTTAEEIALDHTAHALSEVITSTGRIRASPIPTLYTSHTSRLLVFYLACLPPALHVSGLNGPLTTLLTLMVGFAMLGLDELSHIFEQPFRVIPMYQMSKRCMLAVADSFTCQPPPLDGAVKGGAKTEDDDEEVFLSQNDLTTYWSKQDMSIVSDNLME